MTSAVNNMHFIFLVGFGLGSIKFQYTSEIPPWNSMEFRGVPLSIHGVPRSIDGVPWNSMECPCMEIHRNSLIKQLINLLATCSRLNFLLDGKIENIRKLFKSKIMRKFKLQTM